MYHCYLLIVHLTDDVQNQAKFHELSFFFGSTQILSVGAKSYSKHEGLVTINQARNLGRTIRPLWLRALLGDSSLSTADRLLRPGLQLEIINNLAAAVNFS